MLPIRTCEKCGYKWVPREEKPKKCPRCGYRLPEEYHEKYPRLWGSSLGSDYPFPTQRLPTLPEDYQKALDDQKIAVEQRDRDNLHNIDHNILHEVLREQLRALQTPVPSIAKHAEKAKTLNFNQLQNEEEEVKIETERRQEGIEVIETQYLSAENAERVDQGNSIIIKRGGGSDSFPVRFGKDYEEFTALMREKIAVLKEVEEHYASVSAVYVTELKTRASQSPAIIAAAVKEAEAIVKEAEKSSKAISQAAEKCKKSEITDFEAAKEFVRSEAWFNQLENQYFGIKDKLALVIVSEDVTNKLPLFPKAPETYGVATQIRDFVERKHASGF